MSDVDIEVTDGERMDVGGGLSLPKGWDVVAVGEPNVAGVIRLHVAFDERLRRTAAVSVRLDRAREGDEVTAAALRDVRVQYLVAFSSMRMVTVTREGGEPQHFNDYLHDVRSRDDRSYQETVREAVTLYRIATTVNVAPLKLVSENLGVSVSTATRMMARAREVGLAADLITRETYNRMRAQENSYAGPHVDPTSPSGPSIGR
jgi:hypothetical protein